MHDPEAKRKEFRRGDDERMGADGAAATAETPLERAEAAAQRVLAGEADLGARLMREGWPLWGRRSLLASARTSHQLALAALQAALQAVEVSAEAVEEASRRSLGGEVEEAEEAVRALWALRELRRALAHEAAERPNGGYRRAAAILRAALDLVDRPAFAAVEAELEATLVAAEPGASPPGQPLRAAATAPPAERAAGRGGAARAVQAVATLRSLRGHAGRRDETAGAAAGADERERLDSALAAAAREPRRLAERLATAEASATEIAAGLLLAVEAPQTLVEALEEADLAAREDARALARRVAPKRLAAAVLAPCGDPAALAAALHDISPDPAVAGERLRRSQHEPERLADDLLAQGVPGAAAAGAALAALHDVRPLASALGAAYGEAGALAAALVDPELDLEPLAGALLARRTRPAAVADALLTLTARGRRGEVIAAGAAAEDVARELIRVADAEELAGALAAPGSDPGVAATAAGRLAAALRAAGGDPPRAAGALAVAGLDPQLLRHLAAGPVGREGLVESLLSGGFVLSASRLAGEVEQAAEDLLAADALDAAAGRWVRTALDTARRALVAEAVQIADAAEALVQRAEAARRALRQLSDAEEDLDA